MSLSDGATLLRVARESVEYGLGAGRPLAVDLRDHPEELREARASFVTLRIGEALRGCTGSLEATRPLVADVAHNAYASAFRDPRFAPVHEDELGQLSYHVSVLTRPEPLPCASEEELLAKLRPGQDGLILHEGAARATFLPQVWDDLSEPQEFLRHLKQKAGLPGDYWSDRLRFERYQAESVG